MAEDSITVIIPTVGDERRAATIGRAIDSAGPRSGVATRVRVVVNGPRFSPALLERLRADARVDCLQIGEASLPAAIRAGRDSVRTPYFAFLDDDDEFLEGGLALRLDALRADPAAAFAVTAGWRTSPAGDIPQIGLPAEDIRRDPLGALLRENWMASCAGLYRSDAVAAADLRDMPAFLEWTWLGFRLASRLPFRYLAERSFRVHDLAGSVSKSAAYRRGMVPALQAILALDLPPPVRRALLGKLSAAHHDCSTLELGLGERGQAWRHHARSLALPGGLRYLSYTRRLLLPARPEGA